MPQKIVEFMVELTPTKEILVNGRNWSRLHNAEVPVDEQIIGKQVPLEQQLFMICELEKIIAKIRFVYDKTREAQGLSVNPGQAPGMDGTVVGRPR